jgi:hypothetical protein
MKNEEKKLEKLPRTYQIFLAIEKEARGEKSDGTCLLPNKTHREHTPKKEVLK